MVCFRNLLLAMQIDCNAAPIAGKGFSGVIDLMDMKAVHFNGNDGEQVVAESLTPDHPLYAQARVARAQLVDKLADVDSTLFEVRNVDMAVQQQYLSHP
jgi:hypothetical protein